MDLSEVRETYEERGLDVTEVAASPIEQFQRWYQEVSDAGYWEPNAMTLSTVTPEGWPAARVVLLKKVDEQGFVFFTNLRSDKASQLVAVPQAALTFSWVELRRQVRVMGAVDPLSSDEADAYWATRPRGSQLGAWASDQSTVVADREELDQRFGAEMVRWRDEDIERPAHWGGFRVEPRLIEFWQGRPDRLHDRLRYRRQDQEEGQGQDWVIERLAP
ncbi:MAG: pyridoxamine 5'-phosphate oxidase [Actinobacteria bacterium]|nr:pyridoxamine 5'-phosphate oxidase [Actinomycetota bacterium]